MKTFKAVSVLLSVLTVPFFPKPADTVAMPAKSDYYSPAFRTAFFDAAKVFGRAGCGNVELAERVARASLKTGLAAGVIASEIAVESTCNPLAVSSDGGVGLMQIMPKIWASKFDNFREKNLLKEEDSLEVGTEILADNVKTYGLHQGIRHYNGAGPNAESYAYKVMALAGAK